MEAPTATKEPIKTGAMRAGSTALTLLSAPLNVKILQVLEQGPQELIELRRAVGFPPQSTLRLYLKTLLEVGAIENHRRHEFPSGVTYEITTAGRRLLLEVGSVVQAWLREAPAGPLELGSPAARSTLKALIEGWSTNILRALAARQLSLTELSRVIPKVSYPSLERRLSAMRLVHLLEARREGGRSTPYKVTEWLRRSVGPITAAIGWERTQIPEWTMRIGRLDVETIFLLAVPLMKLPDDANGKCRLAVEVHDGTSPVFAGVLVSVKEGAVTSCVAHLDGGAGSWASGKPLAWLRQMNGGEKTELELGGDATLAKAITEGLRQTAYQAE